jgi:hypothetical protein
MQRLTERPWFRRRSMGFGWRPVTWEGWLVTLVAVALVARVLTLVHSSSARFPALILILPAYAAVALRAGGARTPDAPPPSGAAAAPPDTASEPAPPDTHPYEPQPTVPRRRERPASGDAHTLVVERLTKRFGERVAVEDLSFSVAAG